MPMTFGSKDMRCKYPIVEEIIQYSTNRLQRFDYALGSCTYYITPKSEFLHPPYPYNGRLEQMYYPPPPLYNTPEFVAISVLILKVQLKR